MAWRHLQETTDENLIGFCAMDFTTNYGVPIGWSVPSALGDLQEAPSD